MIDKYFSDREFGSRSRTKEEIPKNLWGGIVHLINTGISNGSYGSEFPSYCEDDEYNQIITGCNSNNFALVMKTEVPGIDWPLDPEDPPSTFAILDLIEFCHQYVAKPISYYYHSYQNHHHIKFDSEEGQKQFRNDINKYFYRNGMAYELKNNGKVERLVSEPFYGLLKSAIFNTGDNELDSLLENSRNKILDPNLEVRKESIEKLWDAWERLKTVETGKDKKDSVTKLLDKVTEEENFRQLIEKEANELTDIGNKYRIRHSETDKIPIKSKEHIDYLFHRMFALIWLILLKTNRTK